MGDIAFFVATVWEFLQIEWVKFMYERRVLGKDGEQFEHESKPPSSKLGISLVLLATSVALYIAGALSEVVYFQSTDSASLCKRSYNLVALGNALVNDVAMTGNEAVGQSWILYLSYIVLDLAVPIMVHCAQIFFLARRFESRRLGRLIEWTSAVWCFACVEVLLIGVFAVEYKFPSLVNKIAGDSNSAFLEVDSGLGAGFFLLIAYSVVAGYLQFFLRLEDEPDKGTSEKSREEEGGDDGMEATGTEANGGDA